MKEIIFKNKALPIHFGMRALNEFSKMQNIDFADVATTSSPIVSIESIIKLTAVALNEGARKDGRTNRYSEDDVYDMFDEQPELLPLVSNLFLESVIPLTDKLNGLVEKNVSPTTVENQNQ